MQSCLRQTRPGVGHAARPAASRAPCLVHPTQRTAKLQVCAALKASDLPANLQKIVMAFQMVPDPMARYKQLLFYATKLEKLPDEDHIPANKVEGCVSQVWVKPELRSDGRVYWKADSDSQLTKGLAALLVTGLSGCTPQEIVTLQPEFIEMLGLKQSLTPSRNNGFLNMLKLMQRKTLEAVAAQASSSSEATPSNGHGNGNGNGSSPAAPAAAPAQPAASTSSTPITDSMRAKITEALKPAKLVIENNSASHAGHEGSHFNAGKAGKTGETHFKVEVVSEAFEGKTLVARQRAIYALLKDEFSQGLHALNLDTKTPAEAGLKQTA